MTMMRSYQRFSAALLFGMFFAVFSGVVLAQGNISTYAGNDALFAGGGQVATSAQRAKKADGGALDEDSACTIAIM